MMQFLRNYLRAVELCRAMKPLVMVLSITAFGSAPSIGSPTAALENQSETRWIGTWGVASQPPPPAAPTEYEDHTLRLIVHTSVGGTRVRVKFSNIYGDAPVTIGEAHIARRAAGSQIDATSDRQLTFKGSVSGTIPARSRLVSDPINLDVAPLSDLAISLFFPDKTDTKTSHLLARQTSYVAALKGNWTQTGAFPTAETIGYWPILSGVDVIAKPQGTTVVAFGSSTTDGDGSSQDANRRWPDVLAERLQNGTPSQRALGVLNQGIIGNRLLNDSPADSPLGKALGEAGVTRFKRDVLNQAGVKYVFVALGVNDIVFPGTFTPAADMVTTQDIIVGYRQLIALAHQQGIRIIGTTIPPFENAKFIQPPLDFYTPAKDNVRREVNEWILKSGEFDAAVDFDAAVRDPSHPARILPIYDSGDHLHTNDAGYVATGNAVPLSLFEAAKPVSHRSDH